MWKNFKILFALFLLNFLFSCDSFILDRSKFESDFKSHISNVDTILYDGDYLHPTYAFIKNGKISGLEFNANPECGNYIRRYFLDKNEEVEKIIVDLDSYSEHCENFDSIYLIEPKKSLIKIYTNSTNGKEINNKKLIEEYKISISDYKQQIKKWHYR
jgi:hypothetical protein